MGTIPESKFQPKTTSRAERVSNGQSCSILAARRIGQKAVVNSKVPVDSPSRPRQPNLSGIQSEQFRQCMSGIAVLNKRQGG